MEVISTFNDAKKKKYIRIKRSFYIWFDFWVFWLIRVCVIVKKKRGYRGSWDDLLKFFCVKTIIRIWAFMV
jgi:hypothetical protein